MTPVELTQILTAIENMKSDLARVKTTADAAERKLAMMPSQNDTCGVLQAIEERAETSLNLLNSISINLNIMELNEILGIQIKCRNAVVEVDKYRNAVANGAET
jgi:hypothetical protein